MADERFTCPRCDGAEIRIRVAIDFTAGPQATNAFTDETFIGAWFDEVVEPATWSFYCDNTDCQYELAQSEVPKSYFAAVEELVQLGAERMSLKSDEGW